MANVLEGKKIAVYCAASDLIDKKFLKQGYELGKAIAENGAALVWGGGSTGIMGEVAQGCADNGGTTIGVAPHFIEKFESIFPGTIIIKTEDMAQRKAVMENNSDAFVIAPGGAGTMDEFFQIMCLRQLGQQDKPIIIYNPDGFYDKMIEWMKDAHDKSFIRNNLDEVFHVANSIDGVFQYLKEDLVHEREPVTKEQSLDDILSNASYIAAVEKSQNPQKSHEFSEPDIENP